MIEHIPERVETALLYFHSAGTTSEQFAPFFDRFLEQLPSTYIWAGDGVIRHSPLMGHGMHYSSTQHPENAEHSENAQKRYWFTFPMQDASTQASFAAHAEAMGATLMCGGAYVNALVDQVLARFKLTADKVALCGFQHGGCMALAAPMMRIHDPFKFTILLEPYLLEAYYLKDETTLPNTTVVCVENQYIRERTRKWLHVETDQEFQAYGLKIQQITVADGGDALDADMMQEVINIVQNL